MGMVSVVICLWMRFIQFTLLHRQHMSKIMNGFSKSRNAQPYSYNLYTRNTGVSLAKGPNVYDPHNNGNSSVHKDYRNNPQSNNYPYSNNYKDRGNNSRGQLNTYDYDLEQKEKERQREMERAKELREREREKEEQDRERQKQKEYRIKQIQKRDDNARMMASSEPNYGKYTNEVTRSAIRPSQEDPKVWRKEQQSTSSSSSTRLYRPESTVTLKSKNLALVGLENIGNTCFMNSILQCMLNLPHFNEYFLENRHTKEMTSSSRVAGAYGRLVQLVKNSTSRSEMPSEIKSAVAAKKSRFAGYAQQDAQQFLTALLQLLSQDLNRSRNPKYKELMADLTKQSLSQIGENWWNYNRERENSIVCDYFTGQMLSVVICSTCRNQSIAFDNTWDYALNFSYNDNGELTKMLDNFLKEQTISSDYYCSKCKAFRECKRKLDFFRLPPVLVLQIKRFSYGKYSKQKLNSRIRVNQELNLTPLLTHREHQSTKNPYYQLMGVVNHSGDINGGHYTAQCRNAVNNRWYNFNDSSVSEISLADSFQSSSPYLLFYVKKD